MAARKTMIVIADTGPLLHLFWVDAVAWALPPEPIFVVEAFRREIVSYAPEALNDARIRYVLTPVEVPDTLASQNLDDGERAALAYALTLPVEDVLVLCDELRGRRACRDLSLTVKGSVGLIIEAVQEGRAAKETARAALRNLPEQGRLYVSPKVIAQALAAIDAVQPKEYPDEGKDWTEEDVQHDLDWAMRQKLNP